MMHGHYGIYRLTILILWLVFTLYWAISAQGTKRVINRVGTIWTYAGILILIAIIVLVPREVRAQFIPHSHIIQIAGVILTAAGIAFAIWARAHLGRNWSSSPSIQEEHQLVTRGPYGFVRHPIYTGIILGVFGSAFIAGLIGIYMFVFSTVVVLWRIPQEEKIMMELFPQQYPEYKKQTKRLIPFVW